MSNAEKIRRCFNPMNHSTEWDEILGLIDNDDPENIKCYLSGGIDFNKTENDKLNIFTVATPSQEIFEFIIDEDPEPIYTLGDLGIMLIELLELNVSPEIPIWFWKRVYDAAIENNNEDLDLLGNEHIQRVESNVPTEGIASLLRPKEFNRLREELLEEERYGLLGRVFLMTIRIEVDDELQKRHVLCYFVEDKWFEENIVNRFGINLHKMQ